MTSKSDDPWARFRTRNGDFTHWLHTWTYANVLYAMRDGKKGLTPVPYHAPLPWIFDIDSKVDGSVLKAMYHVGMFQSAPQPWPTFRPYITSNDWRGRAVNASDVLYGVVLQAHRYDVLQRFVRKLEAQCLTTEEVIAYSNRHFCLFKRQQETV